MQGSYQVKCRGISCWLTADSDVVYVEGRSVEVKCCVSVAIEQGIVRKYSNACALDPSSVILKILLLVPQSREQSGNVGTMNWQSEM